MMALVESMLRPLLPANKIIRDVIMRPPPCTSPWRCRSADIITGYITGFVDFLILRNRFCGPGHQAPARSKAQVFPRCLRPPPKPKPPKIFFSEICLNHLASLRYRFRRLLPNPLPLLALRRF